MENSVQWSDQKTLIVDRDNHTLVLRDDRDWIDDIKVNLIPTQYYEELLDLKDKLHRRNMQIKELKSEIGRYQTWIGQHLNDAESYQGVLKFVKETK